jgi:phosphonate transport system substrate-binding protein
MLRLECVVKSFGGKRAVDQVSLVVPAGQLLGVIGQSGSGKSTLLRMINRLSDPTAGQIRFGDTDVTALRGRALRQWRARCAMIFQQFNLAGRLDVLTNVMMGRAFHVPPTRALLKLWTDAEKAMGLSALEGLDMARLAGQRADTLSGGQQQRVAIARALVQEPEIILADEPIASLDPRNTQVVMDALLHINRHFGITVICNLHSLDLARKYCDRLVGLAAGKVVFDGAPAALTDHVARDLYGLESADVLGHAAQPDFVPGAQSWPGPDRHRPSQQGDFLMFTRRVILSTSLVAGTLALAGGAHAQDWKAKYPELVMAVVPAENASGVTERYAPFVEYLSKELGTKVTLRVANDYAAVIEGQRNGSIQIAGYGPASYARAVVTGVKVEPFCTTVNNDGTIGYYSVFYVLADSPYKSIEDLKGKNLGLVDPNSTSGNNVPRFLLNKQKIVPESYFAHVTYTGSHENAVLALQQKTVDVAANWWNAEDDSNLTRMASKGLAKKEDFRIISKSDLIPNSPYAYLADLPPDLKAAIAKAFADAPTKAKAAFDKLSDGKDREFVKVDAKAYEPVVELIKFIDSLRKQKS